MLSPRVIKGRLTGGNRGANRPWNTPRDFEWFQPPKKSFRRHLECHRPNFECVWTPLVCGRPVLSRARQTLTVSRHTLGLVVVVESDAAEGLRLAGESQTVIGRRQSVVGFPRRGSPRGPGDFTGAESAANVR